MSDTTVTATATATTDDDETAITAEVTSNKMTVKEFIYRLFFTREDSLDILQLLFTAVIVMTLAVVWVVSTTKQSVNVKIEALVTLRWLAGMLVITAVPKWLLPDMVGVLSKNPATITRTESQSSTVNETAVTSTEGK